MPTPRKGEEAGKADANQDKGERYHSSGQCDYAEVNGRRVEPERDGAVRLPTDFDGGRIVLHAKAKGDTR